MTDVLTIVPPLKPPPPPRLGDDGEEEEEEPKGENRFGWIKKDGRWTFPCDHEKVEMTEYSILLD